MVKLCERTERLLARLFVDGAARKAVGDKPESECGNGIPFCETSGPEELERIRFAVLKLSKGDTCEPDRAIELANCDWRDLLMEAGFSRDLDAHTTWHDEITGSG
jgi:hypothetical protein